MKLFTFIPLISVHVMYLRSAILNVVRYYNKRLSYILRGTYLISHSLFMILLNGKEFPPILLVSDWPRRHSMACTSE